MVRFLSTVLLASSVFFASCSKSNDNILSDNPTAKASFDHSNYGYYKGVLVGSSGIIAVNIYNNNTLSAYIRLDGVDYNFTTTKTVQGGEGTMLDFVSGNNSFTFIVDGNGERPSIINLVMNGQFDSDKAWLIVKETSTAIVKCYEGRYAGDENGILNTLIYKGEIKGLAKNPDHSGAYEVIGTVSNTIIDASESIDPSAKFKGTVSGNHLSGTWEKAPDLRGNWNGIRTY